MSKFVHPDAAGHDEDTKRLGIEWPELPWTCPGCGKRFENGRGIVATIDPPWGPAEVARATFFCAWCDLFGHVLRAHVERDSKTRGGPN